MKNSTNGTSQNHILITSWAIWSTCYLTFHSRHSDSTETVLRRPCKLRASDITIFSTTMLQFLLLFHCYFPSWPFLDMWNTWSSFSKQTQTWGKKGKILMMIKRMTTRNTIPTRLLLFVLLIKQLLYLQHSVKQQNNIGICLNGLEVPILVVF